VHATKLELPVVLEAGDASIRGVDWGQLRLTVVSVPAGTDFSPLLKGLPNDRCQGPHWGYVVKGRIRMNYAADEEVLSAGDYFHLPPDHTGFAEEDTEFIELAPPDLHDEFLRAARQNLGIALVSPAAN
jgi:hypothetical protein